MQQVLQAVTDEWQPVVRLAAAIGGAADRSAVESTRRACKRLAGQGRVQMDYVRDDDPGERWSAIVRENGYEADARPAHPGWMLAVRRVDEAA